MFTHPLPHRVMSAMAAMSAAARTAAIPDAARRLADLVEATAG